MFGPSSIYGLDIETDNSAGFGLDPRRAGVTEVAVATADGGEVFADESEARLLRGVIEFFNDMPTGLIATWNGSFFDLPYLVDRMNGHLGDVPGFQDGSAGPMLTFDRELKPKYEPLGGHAGGYSAVWFKQGEAIPHQHLDIAQAYRSFADEAGVKWSLKPVAIASGIEMVELDRERLHVYTAAERKAYCLSDASGTRELALRRLGLV